MAPKKTILESIASLASKARGAKAVTTEINTAQRLSNIVDKAIVNSPILRRNYEVMLKRMGTSQTNLGLAKNVLAQVAFYFAYISKIGYYAR